MGTMGEEQEQNREQEEEDINCVESITHSLFLSPFLLYSLPHFEEYLTIYYVPGTVLGARDTLLNKGNIQDLYLQGIYHT